MSPEVCFRRLLGRPLVGHCLPLVSVLVPPSGRGWLCLVEDQGPSKKALHLRPPGLGRCQTTAAFYLPSFPHPLPQSSSSAWSSRLPCFTDETPPPQTPLLKTLPFPTNSLSFKVPQKRTLKVFQDKILLNIPKE